MRDRVSFVLGFSPGSMSDDIARAIAPAFGRELGRSVTIELRPGNNGADAAAEVASATPDGSTLFMATLGTHALAPHLDGALPYDPVEDFAAVSLVSTSPLVLACHRSLDVSTVGELIALARARPRELAYGTSAIGGAPHLAAELFQAMAGVEMRHMRYGETKRLYADLEAGRIALSFNNMMSLLPRCRNGALRALAVTSAGRNAAAEALPTLAECGLPDYEVSNWLGIVAPRATPKQTIDVTSKAAAAALRDPGVRERLSAAGVTPCGSTAAEFAVFMAREIARWGPVVARFRDVAA